MADFLNIYNMDRRKTAVLQNAFDITETQELNKIYTLDFQIPATDEKVKYILPFHFVRFGDKGELYRIIKISYDNSDTSILSVSCEHVIAVLCDELMFGAVQYGGGTIKTSNVISFLLSKQKTQNWILAECDFDRRFEYLWEQENILNALYGIPKEFTKAYKWTFDTTVYPWRLSLKAIDATIHPEYYIRAKRNLLSSGTAQDYTGVCTRIYPLGYGEGVNQLGIKEINNGLPYLQSPAAIVAEYGIKEKVLVDRRFEDAESLKSYAQTMLDGLQTPSMTRSFDVVDLYPLTSQAIDRAEVGKICRMTGDDTIAYITKTKRVLDEPGNLEIDLSTKATDVASAIADFAERVRIETVYAQGATQLYQHSKDANATPTKGMVMSLYFPAEMRQINKVLLRLKLGSFRSYSQTTKAGGGSTATSSSGGGSIATSSSGGGSIATSSSGGGSTATSTSGGGSTATSSDGGAQGSTSTSGGGNINVTLSGSAEETEDPNWKGSPYTDTAEPDAHVNHAGEHEHDLGNVSGSTDQIAIPLDNTGTYWHRHSIESFSGYATSNGRHNHDAYVDAHNHTIPRSSLKHTHKVNITVKSNTPGQVGFAHSHTFSVGNHTHTIQIPSHTHDVVIPSHTHDVSIPNHTHDVSIPNHTHDVSIPNHTHEIEAGIFESGNPTGFSIYVDGTYIATINATSYNADIATWLLDKDNQIPRNSWIDIEIRPNDLAYVQSSVFIQGFVQSRGGGNY